MRKIIHRTRRAAVGFTLVALILSVQAHGQSLEPANDTFDGAVGPLTATPLGGRLETINDRDFFYFGAKAASVLTFRISPAEPCGDVFTGYYDPLLGTDVYDAGHDSLGVEFEPADDDPRVRVATWTTPYRDGAYFLEVHTVDEHRPSIPCEYTIEVGPQAALTTADPRKEDPACTAARRRYREARRQYRRAKVDGRSRRQLRRLRRAVQKRQAGVEAACER